MMIDPQRLTQLASEWDPQPFMQAMEQRHAAPGGSFPGEPEQMSYANMMGLGGNSVASGGAPMMNPLMMGMGGLNMMQQSQGQQPQARAPAAQPRRGAPMSMPAMPQPGMVPDLAQILGRR